MKPADHDHRLARVRTALDGLSIGDAFGQQFFSRYVQDMHLPSRRLPPPKWKYTDDTMMALAIAEVLEQSGQIDQDALAQNLVVRYRAEPDRGYGEGARRLLAGIAEGGDWRGLARSLFYGEGSKGNGAAMRVAPIGAYFSDDLTQVADAARQSAEITHAHPDGIAGAIAIALAVACVSRHPISEPHELLTAVWERTPDGAVRSGIARAQKLALDEWEHSVVAELGNGEQLTAADTVPFCLWCAAAHLHDFPAAMWAAAQVGGDRDTNCAIIGGIVGAAVGAAGIPDEWRRSRESLWLRSDR